jgi:protein phosphatase 2C family protein 2/3
MRIIPGRLSVSRAFGDKDAKLNDYGENNNILICTPEIVNINLRNQKVDFLIMGCDGIFEYLTNEDCVSLAWKIMKENIKNYNNFHQMNGDIVDLIIKSALKRNSIDNVSVLFVSFKNFKKKFKKGKFFSISNYSNINFNDINDNELNNKNENNNNLMNKEHNKKNIEKMNIVYNNNDDNIKNE